MCTLGILVGISLKRRGIRGFSYRDKSLPKQVGSNALITIGIIIAGIIKRGGGEKNPEINTGYLLQR